MTAADVGKALLREVGPTVASSLVELMRTAARSRDPNAVARHALAEATKLAADLEVKASFAAKRAVKKAVRR
jgi:hypothetical protein